MFRKKHTWLLAFTLLCVLIPLTAHGGWLDSIKKAISTNDTTSPSNPADLSNADIVSGLKEALSNAVGNAIALLGTPGGYLNNLDVKIPMPENLQTAERAARALGQGDLADEFIVSMNNAAEKSVPETVSIFAKAIKNMSFSDARSILEGPDNAATSFFQKSSSAELFNLILPIVQEATNAVGVTNNYKSLMNSVSVMGSMIGMETSDLDSYVTNKAIAGLFTIMAVEEKKIRDNPAERTTDLLKKVFGVLD